MSLKLKYHQRKKIGDVMILLRSFSIKCVFAILTIFFSLSFSHTDKKQYIIIQNVNVFDGETYFENVNFIIKDGIIIDILKENKIYENARIIDGKQKTIIPPLLNAHVHVWRSKNLKDAIKSGVFALLDMHTSEESAKFLRQFRDSVGYASYYSSGPGATVPKGHGTEGDLKRKSHFCRIISDRPSPDTMDFSKVQSCDGDCYGIRIARCQHLRLSHCRAF